jgi:hypothetical protein
LKQEEPNAYHRIELGGDELQVAPRHWDRRSSFRDGETWRFRRRHRAWVPDPET